MLCAQDLRTGPSCPFSQALTPPGAPPPSWLYAELHLHVAWSCPCRSKPSAPESPQAYLKIPSSLDLQILTWGKRERALGTWEMLDVSSAHSSSDYFFQPSLVTVLSLLCFMVLESLFKIHPGANTLTPLTTAIIVWDTRRLHLSCHSCLPYWFLLPPLVLQSLCSWQQPQDSFKM